MNTELFTIDLHNVFCGVLTSKPTKGAATALSIPIILSAFNSYINCEVVAVVVLDDDDELDGGRAPLAAAIVDASVWMAVTSDDINARAAVKRAKSFARR